MTKYDVDAVVNNNEEYLDSREVAHMVGKEHFHLMRDIKDYIKDIEDNPNLDSTSFFLSLFHPKEELLARYNNDTLKGSN